MRKILFILPAMLVLSLILGPGHAAWAQSDAAEYYDADTYDSEEDLLSDEELEDLLAPIALYPDPLIAQILPAATFVDQIEEAAAHVRRFGKSARIDDQPWDVSVKAVAHYPDVLFMMERNFEWTVSLGQAFIDQQQDVMDAIQRLRADARAQGNLFSTRQQQVIYEADLIRIVPAAPQYVYVPVYDPQVVYVERYNPSYPFITFGIGLSIGAWLSRDCDWRQRRVYYHGWRGSGWVNRARPHIQDRRGVYINRRAAAININNRVRLHDTSHFRQQLRSDTWRMRQERVLATPPARTRPLPGTTIEQRRSPGADRQRPPGVIRQRTPGAEGRERPQRSIRQQRTPLTGGERPSSPATGRQRPPAVRQQTAPATGQPPPATVPKAPLATVPQAPAIGQQAPPPALRQQRQPASGGPEERPRSRAGFRSRDVQTQPASPDSTIHRQRGQAGRERRQVNRPAAPTATQPAVPIVAPAPTVAPVPAPTIVPAPGAGAVSEPPGPRPAATPGRERPAHQLRQRGPTDGVPPAQRPAVRDAPGTGN